MTHCTTCGQDYDETNSIENARHFYKFCGCKARRVDHEKQSASAKRGWEKRRKREAEEAEAELEATQ